MNPTHNSVGRLDLMELLTLHSGKDTELRPLGLDLHFLMCGILLPTLQGRTHTHAPAQTGIHYNKNQRRNRADEAQVQVQPDPFPALCLWRSPIPSLGLSRLVYQAGDHTTHLPELQ